MDKKAKVIGFLKKPIKLHEKAKPVPFYIILIGLVVFLSSARYILLKDKWETLDVEWHGYSMAHPALYSTKTYIRGGRGVNLDYLSASVSSYRQFSSFGPIIYIHQITLDNPELVDAVEWGQEFTRKGSLVETHIGYGNYPAMMQSYYKGTQLTNAYFVVSENKAYLIEIRRVNEDNQLIVDQMLASFRLYKISAN